jgi:predicted metal-dependent phosphoesterase TrpH
VDRGFVGSMNEAFCKYIGDNKIADVKKKNPHSLEVIELIKELGGMAFLAHPGKHFLWDDIEDFVDSGIDGIEVIHPTHSKAKTEFLCEYADEKNLLKSGGSDFHGIFEKDFTNLGKYYIDENEIQSLINL